jgi:hypothetical protein
MDYYKQLVWSVYIGTYGLLPDSVTPGMPVPGYEKVYEITWNGTVRTKSKRSKERVLQQRIDRAGYLTVRLHKNGKSCTHLVHRLLADALIPNYLGKKYVNHRNGIKICNRLLNLEWSTHQENVIHAYKTGLTSKASQMKMVVDNCTGKRYSSVKEAAEALRIPYSTCKNYLNGRRPNPTCLQYAA